MAKPENIPSQKSNNLIVDACGNEAVKIWLNSQEDNSLIFKSEDKNFHNETILAEIVDALNNNNLTIKELKNIYVCAGPGSYMGSRTIAVIFNTIVQETNIPLWQFEHNQKFTEAKKVNEIAPVYNQII